MVRALALVVVLSGCDLIFTPAPLASDAPTSTDGPGGDGSSIDDANGDGPVAVDASADAGSPDGTMPDATCSPYACSAPDLVAGTPNTGTAGCASPGFCTGYPVLNSIDLCSCTAGQPELYVIPAGGSFAQIGLVALAPSTGMYSLSVDGACVTGAVTCPAATCPGGFDLWVWDSVPVTPGTLNFITIYEDDGSACAAGEIYFYSVMML